MLIVAVSLVLYFDFGCGVVCCIVFGRIVCVALKKAVNFLD
jgi:hypothetical protein